MAQPGATAPPREKILFYGDGQTKGYVKKIISIRVESLKNELKLKGFGWYYYYDYDYLLLCSNL